VRVVVWALLALLALTVLPVVVLVFAGLIRRFQIWRTSRELQRMGFVGSSGETRSIWPRLGVGLAGMVALIIAAGLLPGGPLGRNLASTVVAALPAPTHAPFIPAGTSPGSEHPSSQEPATTHGAGSPPASTASSPAPASSASPAAAGGDNGAPSTVSALPASATAIQLHWASVAGASQYHVERSTDSVHWRVVACPGAEQTRFTDGKLSSGTTYYYRVAAVVDGNDVYRSDVVSATTIVETPVAPVWISATSSATSVDLVWSNVDGELGYRIERSPDGTNDWAQIGTTGQGVTSYTDTGLASVTTYYYRVFAGTADGESSPPSTTLSVTTDPSGLPTSEPNAAQSTP